MGDAAKRPRIRARALLPVSESAALVLAVVLAIASFMPNAREQTALRATAAALVVYALLWHNVVPRRISADQRRIAGALVLQAIAAGLVIATGGVDSRWFVFYTLPMLASVMAHRTVVTAAVAAGGLSGLVVIWAIDPLAAGDAASTRDVAMIRFVAMVATAALAMVVARASERSDRELQSARAASEQLALLDPLTGLYNRRVIDREVSAMHSLAERSGRRFSVIAVDVDGLKKVNDAFGHFAGDVTLRGVAQAIRGSVRPYDVAARTGGDEFVVLVREGTEEPAQAVAQRLHYAVMQLPANAPGALPVTVSTGCATWSPGMSSADVLDAADQHLYAHKRRRGMHAVPHESAS